MLVGDGSWIYFMKRNDVAVTVLELDAVMP